MKRSKPLRRSGKLKPRSPRNKGGQVALFNRIWDSRPHKCEVCGVAIKEPTASNFSHIISKGAYPSMKLDERNVEIWCQNCHLLYTIKDVSVASRPMWKRVHEKAILLSLEANGVTPKP